MYLEENTRHVSLLLDIEIFRSSPCSVIYRVSTRLPRACCEWCASCDEARKSARGLITTKIIIIIVLMTKMLPDARDQCSSLFVISGVNSSNRTPRDSNSAYLGMKFDLTRLQRSCLGARLRSLYCSSCIHRLSVALLCKFIISYELVMWLYRMLIECIILESNSASQSRDSSSTLFAVLAASDPA